MAICDLCGRSGADKIALVEGARVTACDNCASLGEVVDEVEEPISRREVLVKREKKEKIAEVMEEIRQVVREEREKRQWSQEEFGKKINESASLVKRIEHGYIPPMKIARKIERLLNVTLVESVDVEEEDMRSEGPEKGTTLGDVIVIRKKDG